MATATFRNFLYDDQIIYGNASSTTYVVTKGDWLGFSGICVRAANTAQTGGNSNTHWKVSGAGMALGNNPWYDELGVARANTALPILRRGVVRVTATSGVGDGSDFTLGLPVIPTTTASGIVGQTGATGIGAIWNTAAFANVSAGTSYVPGAQGGVATLINIVVGGSTGKWDIALQTQGPDFI